MIASLNDYLKNIVGQKKNVDVEPLVVVRVCLIFI